MVIHGFLKCFDRRFENVAYLLCAARRPVGQFHPLRNTPLRQLERRGRRADIFIRGGDSYLTFAEDVERLIDESERVDIAAVGLAWPQIFVLKLELRIGKQPRLFSEPFSSGDSFGFGFQRCAGLERFV